MPNPSSPNYPARCEDAPCCGCCGTNIYGVNQEDPNDTGMTKDDYLEMMMDGNDDDYMDSNDDY